MCSNGGKVGAGRCWRETFGGKKEDAGISGNILAEIRSAEN